jgi:autotransporter family porin
VDDFSADSALFISKGREFKPYIGANWLHNTHEFGVRMNDVYVGEEGARNIAQLKLGVQG